MGERKITTGEWYDEATLKDLFREPVWDWWFGIEGLLLISGRGHQFSFTIDRRRTRPYFLRGLSKGSIGNWENIAESDHPTAIKLVTLRPISDESGNRHV